MVSKISWSSTHAHAKQVAYVKVTVQGKAFDHLITYLKQFDENKTVTWQCAASTSNRYSMTPISA
jgi:hypothetical protein